MKPHQLSILRAVTTALWTSGTALLFIALAATTRGRDGMAMSCYALAVFLVTIGSVCSLWLVCETVANRVADRLRDELADAVGMAMRDYMEAQREPTLYVMRQKT
jgi:hypothetical protein